MKESNLKWNFLWGETQEARLEELREYVKNFPDGIIADCCMNEIAHLEEIKRRYDS